MVRGQIQGTGKMIESWVHDMKQRINKMLKQNKLHKMGILFILYTSRALVPTNLNSYMLYKIYT